MRTDRGGTGAPPVSEGVMHVVSLLAIVAVGLTLSIMTVVGVHAIPHDALDEAQLIEGLPFRDDGVSLSTASAAPDDPRPSCVAPSHTAWYVFQPESDVPLSAWVVPDDGGEAALDVALSVWMTTGDGEPTELACIDDRGAGAAEQLVMAAPTGGVYHFAVSAREQLDETAGTLTVLVDAQQPAHDLFAFARWVEATPYRDADVDATAARREPGEVRAGCTDMGATTWYGISTPVDAVLSARVAPAATSDDPLDLAMALHTGPSVEALTERACVDGTSVAEAERLEAPLSGGEVYWLAVGAVLGAAGPGSYTLSIDGMQSIELAPLPDTVFGDGPLSVAAEASSGLPVTIAVDGPCEVGDGRLTLGGAGLCTITATQPGDEAWAPAQPVTTTLRIGRGSQAITLEPVGGTRVGVPVPVSASAQSGLPVRIAASGPCELEDGTIVPSAAGTCVITATQPGDDDWAPAEPVTITVPIARGRQSVELAPPAALSVGEAVELEAASSSGLPVELEADGACRVRGTDLLGTAAGPCTVTATQPGDDDWAPAEPVSRTLRIARGEQTIELGDTPGLVFGADPFEIAAEAGSGLPVTLETEGPCRVRDGALVSTGAGTCLLRASQPGDADWAPAEPLTRTITIAPARQTLELAPTPTLTVGDTAPLEAGSSSGLPVSIEAAGPCTIEAGSLVPSAAGTCVITATQPGDADWAAAEPLVRRVTIDPASQSLELAPPAALSVGQAVELEAASSSGLPVELEASGPCLVSSGRLRALGAGPCTVTATQPGDDDWAPAEPVSRTLRIARGEQTIELGDIESQALGDGSVELSASSNAGLPVELTASGPCRLDGDRAVFDGSGECTITASHPGDADWTPAEASRSFRIVAPGEAWREAEDELLERTAALACSTVGAEQDPRPLGNGALAGVRCDEAMEGISALWLFTYADTEGLEAFHEQRIDDGRGTLQEDPEACLGGRSGVTSWEHGRVACWISEGGPRPVLHWTDERANVYGIIRPFAGAEGRLDELWTNVVDQLFAAEA